MEIEVPKDIRDIWTAEATPVVKYPDPVLRQVAEPVGKPDRSTRDLVEYMKVVMRQARGLGLAAPQVGVSQRLLIYRLQDENSPLRVLIDPKILSMKGEQVGPEGCLSFPHLHGDVTRANEVIVRATDMLGRTAKRRVTEMEARVIQHEMDHLDGILFIDRADTSTLGWVLPGDDDDGLRD